MQQTPFELPESPSGNEIYPAFQRIDAFNLMGFADRRSAEVVSRIESPHVAKLWVSDLEKRRKTPAPTYHTPRWRTDFYLHRRYVRHDRTEPCETEQKITSMHLLDQLVKVRIWHCPLREVRFVKRHHATIKGKDVDSVKISIDEIQPGVVCGSDVCDEDGRVLLSRGVRLSEAVLQRISERNITHIQVDPADLSTLRGEKKPQARDPSSKRRRVEASPESPTGVRRVDRSHEPYSEERAERFSRQLEYAIELVEEIGAQREGMSTATLKELCSVPEQIAEMLVEDSDQSLSSAKSDSGATPLAQRCAQMSMLSMSTALEMELSESDVFHVGIAGLLHDLGLYLLPETLRDPTKTLSFEETEIYRSHPDLTLRLLNDFSSIPKVAHLLILQVHELPDGGGFPRGIRAHRMHSLARILSAVEVYLALINPGPGRPAVVPHDALGFMLYQCRNGTFDVEVMRSFINQMSLFPIGSLVALDNGENATVIRRDGDHYDRPVVIRKDSPHTEPVALSESNHAILAPIHDHSSEMRIEKGLVPSLTLEEMLFA